MSPPADGLDPSQNHAIQLIERSGILARTQIIADLNVERDKDQNTFEKLLAEIANDEPLATRVIHLANSAWFGGRVKVESVEVAFGRLGIKDFYKAAMAAALRFRLDEATEHSKWWQHSETIAHLCEMVAQHLNPELVEPAFQAGLLRDCAVPLMIKHVADYSYLANEALGFASASIEIETECNQTNHCVVGTELVAAWKFPQTHRAAVQSHHAQSLSGAKTPEAKQTLAVVLMAERVEGWSKIPDTVFFAGPEEDALRSEIARAFAITTETVDDTMAEMLRLYRLRQSHA